MEVVVDVGVEPATVTLEEPADCKRFHVTVRGGAGAGPLDEALRAGAVGSLNGDGEALVFVDAVRRLAVGQVDESWESDFAAMLGYADSKGWLSDDGASIRAHVERG
jgi:hypothetical protein